MPDAGTAEPREGQPFVEPVTGISFVWIPGGPFGWAPFVVEFADDAQVNTLAVKAGVSVLESINPSEDCAS